MNKSGLMGAIAVLALLYCCYLFAQSGPAANSFGPEDRAQFQIIPSSGATCLLDLKGGRTWILGQQLQDTPVWFPVPILEKGYDKAKWIGSFQEPRVPTSDLTIANKLTFRSILEKEGYRTIKLHHAYSGYLVAKGKINDKTLNLVIDTGAPNTHLDKSRTKDLGLTWKKLGSGNYQCYVSSVELETIRTGGMRVGGGIRIGDHDFSEINEKTKPYGDLEFDGIIGSDILGPSRAIIDYQTCILYIMDR